MQRAYGFSEQGARHVWTNGYPSFNVVQESWPYSRITVYLNGTTILATIFHDDNTPPTPLSNPFTSDENGWWWFYAPNGRYDVQIDPVNPPNCAWTIGDVYLYDTGEDPNANLIAGPGIIITPNPSPPKPASTVISADPVWPGDNNANGFALTDLGSLTFGSGVCSMTLKLDANCSLGFYDANGNEVAWITQQGDFNGRNGNFSGDLTVGGTLTLGGGAGGGTLEAQLVQTNCLQLTNPATPLTMWFCLDANGDGVISDDSKVEIARFHQTGTGSLFWVTDHGGNAQHGIAVQHLANDTSSSSFYCWKQRGTAPVQAGDWISYFGWGGLVNGFSGNHGAISAQMNPDAKTADLLFFMNDGTMLENGVERMRLTALGRVGFGAIPNQGPPGGGGGGAGAITGVGVEIANGELRISGTSFPTSGSGMELWYQPGVWAGIENFNYDTNAYEDIVIEARYVTINPQIGPGRPGYGPGFVGIGFRNPMSPLAVLTVDGRGISSRAYSNDRSGPTIYLDKGRGIPDNPQPVQVGDNLGYIGFGGRLANPINGFVSADGAEIIAVCTAVFANEIAGDLIFQTNDGTAPQGTGYERMRIKSDGDVYVQKCIYVGASGVPVSLCSDGAGNLLVNGQPVGGGTVAGVASLNGLTGAITLAAGSNVTVTPSGNTITISATGGGTVSGGGLPRGNAIFSPFMMFPPATGGWNRTFYIGEDGWGPWTVQILRLASSNEATQPSRVWRPTFYPSSVEAFGNGWYNLQLGNEYYPPGNTMFYLTCPQGAVTWLDEGAF